MTKTPLSEVEANSLDILFSADPLDLTDNDVDKLVDEYRATRALWQKEDSEAQAQGRPRKTKVYKEAPAAGKLNLGDLGMGKKES